jgi:hypothetical protein
MRLHGRAAALLRILALAVLFAAIPAARALASTQQVSMLEDDTQLLENPAGTLARLRVLGTQVVRVAVPWESIAPNPNVRRAPRGFNGSDPAAYPRMNWAIWDEIVFDARRNGIEVDFDLMGGAPRWALGPGQPAGNKNPNWEPSAAAYGKFVRAVGIRYSGDYDPLTNTVAPGSADDLPRVGFWSIWNEPDYGPSLAPQGVPGNLRVENSPRMYRGLVNAAWSALQATSHTPSIDTIVFGELAPRGEANWGVFSGMKPLVFLQALYCVDSNDHELRGSDAKLRGCPTTAAGSRRFRAQNPGLFEATGVSDHPYMRWYAPNHELNPDPTNGSTTRDYTSLGVIGNLTRALDRLQRAYGSTTRFPVYDTEFGYITSPPKRSPDPDSRTKVIYLPPATAASYMNWAEYITWRHPRLRSFTQYLLYDPLRPSRSNDSGGFASGLLTWTGVQKATYDAWRLPLYLPVTKARAGQSLEVWGCVRPAQFGLLDSGTSQTAEIQFSPSPSAPFETLQTVTVGEGDTCYFDSRVTFPSGGSVRLAYTYPSIEPAPAGGIQVFSRTVKVTLR